MLNTEIDKLILESVRNHQDERTAVLRLIKAKFIEFKTAKNAKPLDEIAEITILKKMVQEREESARMYIEGGRESLTHSELQEAEIIREFLPKPVTEDEVEEKVQELIKEIEPIKKNMGIIIKKVKETYPQADGKIVSGIVANILK